MKQKQHLTEKRQLMKSRNLLYLFGNLLIVVGLGAVFYTILQGISGGDILLTLIFCCSCFLQLIILIISMWRKRQRLYVALTGFLIGVIICVATFKGIEHVREQRNFIMQTPSNL